MSTTVATTTANGRGSKWAAKHWRLCIGQTNHPRHAASRTGFTIRAHDRPPLLSGRTSCGIAMLTKPNKLPNGRVFHKAVGFPEEAALVGDKSMSLRTCDKPLAVEALRGIRSTSFLGQRLPWFARQFAISGDKQCNGQEVPLGSISEARARPDTNFFERQQTPFASFHTPRKSLQSSGGEGLTDSAITRGETRINAVAYPTDKC